MEHCLEYARITNTTRICKTHDDKSIIVYNGTSAFQVWLDKSQLIVELVSLALCTSIICVDDGYVAVYDRSDADLVRLYTVSKFRLDGSIEWYLEENRGLTSIRTTRASATVCGNVVYVTNQLTRIDAINLTTGELRIHNYSDVAEVFTLATNEATNDLIVQYHADSFDPMTSNIATIRDGVVSIVTLNRVGLPAGHICCDSNGRVYAIDIFGSVNIYNLYGNFELIKKLKLPLKAKAITLNLSDELVVVFQTEICVYPSIDTKPAAAARAGFVSGNTL